MPLNLALALASLNNASRLLIEAELRVAPGAGDRFQPTGFPDLGPALYKGIQKKPLEKGSGTSHSQAETMADDLELVHILLVESVQSMANRLEEVCLDGDDYNSDCQGIPYVRVLDGHRNSAFLTSSVREPHRLASPYVLASKSNSGEYRKSLAAALGANKERPIHIWKMAPELFKRDPGCLLHGVFLEEIDGRIRLPRLVSGCIEATDPNTVNSGGVYRGEVTAKDNIPYPRQEFTSPAIKASFVIHLGTLRGYNLDQADPKKTKSNFLVLWALYKIDRFLHGYLRLRTACEFEVGKITTKLDGKDWTWSHQASPGTWPSSAEILKDFVPLRDQCFPLPQGTTRWADLPIAARNVVEVTYAVDIKAQEELPAELTESSFKLTGFENRARLTQSTKGKGAQKKTVTVLEITGEWSEDDQAQLLALNPAFVSADDQQQDNPAHEIVKNVLKKWNDELEKQRKRAGVTEESEG